MESVSFPKTGLSADSVLKELTDAKANDVKWLEGKAFSLGLRV